MSGFGWLGIIASSFVSTLALASWVVMALPYFDNAPYLTELKRKSGATMLVGGLFFILFFIVFLLGGLYLDETTSGPLLAFAAFVLALPFSMLLGSETWDHYDARGMNKVPAVRAVVVATGIGLAEIAGATLLVMAVYQVT
jgi:hypothetical protein